MKTKAIITAMLLLFSLTSFAQTKEETIAWIKEKLEQHGGVDSFRYTNVNVSPCSISFTMIDYQDFNVIYSFNPSAAKSWGSDINVIGADADIIHSPTLNTDSNWFFIRNGESGIHERMIKALVHLATFCEKKEEAF